MAPKKKPVLFLIGGNNRQTEVIERYFDTKKFRLIHWQQGKKTLSNAPDTDTVLIWTKHGGHNMMERAESALKGIQRIFCKSTSELLIAIEETLCMQTHGSEAYKMVTLKEGDSDNQISCPSLWTRSDHPEHNHKFATLLAMAENEGGANYEEDEFDEGEDMEPCIVDPKWEKSDTGKMDPQTDSMVPAPPHISKVRIFAEVRDQFDKIIGGHHVEINVDKPMLDWPMISAAAAKSVSDSAVYEAFEYINSHEKKETK